MHFDNVSYKIAEHFLPYLINGDCSGMSDQEIQDADEFQSDVLAEMPNGHWATSTDYSDDFTICEITGLAANCAAVDWVYRTLN